MFAAFGGLAVVAVTVPDALPAARAAVEDIVAQFDRACSRFREDSEISAVNRSGGGWVAVSPLFLEAAQAALRAAALTDGDVDPTVGDALITLGYDRDFDDLAGGRRARPAELARVPGWRTVRVDAPAGALRVPPGVKLDLGATAKALAADRAAAAAAAAAGCGTLVSLSGDLAIVGAGPAGGWRIRVTDDHRSDFDAPGQWIALESGGLATSSTTARRWRMGPEVAHHLVDPATGASAKSPWRTVSVTAATCLDANIASTASIIRGRSAPGWLEEQRLPGRLVDEGGEVRHVAGWPHDGDDLGCADRDPRGGKA